MPGPQTRQHGRTLAPGPWCCLARDVKRPMIFRYFGQKSHRNRVKGNATVKNLMRFRGTFKRLLVKSHLKCCACPTKKGNPFLLVSYVSQVPSASLIRGGARKGPERGARPSIPPRDGLLRATTPKKEIKFPPQLNPELVDSQKGHTSSFPVQMLCLQAESCDLFKFRSLRKWPHLTPTSENQQSDEGRGALARRRLTSTPLSLHKEEGPDEGGKRGPIKFNSMVTTVILL